MSHISDAVRKDLGKLNDESRAKLWDKADRVTKQPHRVVRRDRDEGYPGGRPTMSSTGKSIT